jgi:hypothetical protein
MIGGASTQRPSIPNLPGSAQVTRIGFTFRRMHTSECIRDSTSNSYPLATTSIQSLFVLQSRPAGALGSAAKLLRAVVLGGARHGPGGRPYVDIKLQGCVNMTSNQISCPVPNPVPNLAASPPLTQSGRHPNGANTGPQYKPLEQVGSARRHIRWGWPITMPTGTAMRRKGCGVPDSIGTKLKHDVILTSRARNCNLLATASAGVVSVTEVGGTGPAAMVPDRVSSLARTGGCLASHSSHKRSKHDWFDARFRRRLASGGAAGPLDVRSSCSMGIRRAATGGSLGWSCVLAYR